MKFFGADSEDFYVEETKRLDYNGHTTSTFRIRVAVYILFFKIYVYYSKSTESGLGIEILSSSNKTELITLYKTDKFKKITIINYGK